MFSYTDAGNGERFVSQHKQNIRWCPEWKTWAMYDSRKGVWRKDSSDKVLAFALQTARSILKDIQDGMTSEETMRIRQFATQSENVNRLKAMACMAKSDNPIGLNDFDQNLWLFNTQNGTINLISGEFRDHKREDFLTKISPTMYDEKAICPRWIQFLKEVFKDDVDLVEYAQRICGAAIVGHVSDRQLFIFYGSGRNGKTTFVEVIRKVLGSDYTGQLPFDVLISNKFGSSGSGPTPELAALRGTRFVSASEGQTFHKLATALVKRLTGKNMIIANPKYECPVEFYPQFTLVLETNHLPYVDGTDIAFWDRICVVPFTVRIPDDKVDPYLDIVLEKEKSGILNWILEGCRMWQEIGISKKPGVVIDAIREYRSESDPVGRFLDSDAVFIGKGLSSSTAEAHKAYLRWAEENGEPPLKMKTFVRRVGGEFVDGTPPRILLDITGDPVKIERVSRLECGRKGGWVGFDVGDPLALPGFNTSSSPVARPPDDFFEGD